VAETLTANIGGSMASWWVIACSSVSKTRSARMGSGLTRGAGVRIVRAAVQVPNANAYAEGRRPRADDRGAAESPGRREGEGLVGPAPLSDDRLNRATEPVEVDGLAQIRIEGLGLQIVLLESGESDNRDLSTRRQWMPANLADEFHAVHSWHREVSDDRIKPRSGIDVGQATGSAARKEDVRAACGQKGREHLEGIGIVINNEQSQAAQVGKIRRWGSGHRYR